MSSQEKSFSWIVALLNKHNIPFVITGGLAARCYGSTRPLNDFDIDVHDQDVATVAKLVEPYITFGPAILKDDKWDLLALTLIYEGQEIDITGAETPKIFDNKNKSWVSCPTSFDQAEKKEIFGHKVLVISKQELIDYKSLLSGDHQKSDISAIHNYS